MKRLVAVLALCCCGLLAAGAGQGLGKPAPGSIDPSFGFEGVITQPRTPIPSSGTYGPFGEDMAIGTEDDIFVLQSYRNCQVRNCTVEFFVQRFLPDGALDLSFGNEGSTERVAVSMLLADNALLGGNALGSLAVDSTGEAVVATTSNGDVTLFRFDASGRLSTAFGSGGVVTSDFGGDESLPKVAIDRQGRIVVASGSAQGRFFRSFVILARYFPDGALDPTFGTGLRESQGPGWLRIPGFKPGAVGISASGGLMVAGSRCCPGKTMSAVYSGRRSERGKPLGGVTASRPWRYLKIGRNAWVSSVIPLRHGRVYLVGASGAKLFAARLQPSGRLDRRFGKRGLTWFPKMTSGASPALADAAGRLYVAGDRWGGEEYVPNRALLARLTVGGRHDLRWGHSPPGYARLTNWISNPLALGFQSNGRLVVFGEYSGDCIRGCLLPGRTLTRVFTQ